MGPPQQPLMGAGGEPVEAALPGVAGGPRGPKGRPAEGQTGMPGVLPGDGTSGDGAVGDGGFPDQSTEELLEEGEFFAQMNQWAELHNTIKDLAAITLDPEQQQRFANLRKRLRKAAHGRADEARRLLPRAKRDADYWKRCVSLLQEAQAWDPDGPAGDAYQRAEKLLQQLPPNEPDP